MASVLPTAAQSAQKKEETVARANKRALNRACEGKSNVVDGFYVGRVD